MKSNEDKQNKGNSNKGLKYKIVAIIALLLVGFIICGVMGALKYFDVVELDNVSQSVHGELSDKDMNRRVRSYLKDVGDEMPARENTAIVNMVSETIIPESVGAEDVVKVLSAVAIAFVVAVVWIRDTVRRRRERLWRK